ncbi:hypothetical protein XENORESO_006334 [Xenotaenia resolanae]|uniref:EF-hand domain-containing protein n=1 Tax=Xenotaenia resolanae TaxID=208358 RepID=A0ABV0WFJ2_9TELE
MESAIKTMVTTFLSSAKGKESLDSKSFQKLVQKQLGNVMEDTNSSSAIKEMQQGLDENNDGKVSFQEYLSMIGYLANSLTLLRAAGGPLSTCAPDRCPIGAVVQSLPISRYRLLYLQLIVKAELHLHSENASTLENAMQLMIQTFHKYSGNEGDKYTLSRAELKELLTTELGTYLGNAQDKEAVDKVMNDLDSNNDGEVDFTEFVILVGALTVACNDFFLEYNDKPGKK